MILGFVQFCFEIENEGSEFWTRSGRIRYLYELNGFSLCQTNGCHLFKIMLIPELCPKKSNYLGDGEESEGRSATKKQFLKTNTVIFVTPQCEDQKEFLSNKFFIFLL